VYPSFGHIERDDVKRAIILSSDQVADNCIPISFGRVSLDIGCAVFAEIAEHQMHVIVMAGDEGRQIGLLRYITAIERIPAALTFPVKTLFVCDVVA
jgi:hypothetical protein